MKVGELKTPSTGSRWSASSACAKGGATASNKAIAKLLTNKKPRRRSAGVSRRRTLARVLLLVHRRDERAAGRGRERVLRDLDLRDFERHRARLQSRREQVAEALRLRRSAGEHDRHRAVDARHLLCRR